MKKSAMFNVNDNNDNVNFLKENNNDNVNDTSSKYDSNFRYTAQQVDRIAKKVCNFVGGDWQKSKAFYCKVAWNLPESLIFLNAEEAVKKGKNPPALFNYLCRQSLANK